MDRVDRTRLVESCGSRYDGLWCFKVQQGQAVWRDAQLADPAAPGECGKMEDQDVRRECDVQAGNEQLIGRRFSVVRKRRMEETSHSDDVTKRHQVMCKRDWPEKGYSCINVWIQVRIARRVERIVPSVKVTREVTTLKTR